MAEKKSRLVKTIIPMMGIDFIENSVEEMEWDNEFPMPPENTEIVLVGSYIPLGLVARDKDNNEGYFLKYDCINDRYFWKKF